MHASVKGLQAHVIACINEGHIFRIPYFNAHCIFSFIFLLKINLVALISIEFYLSGHDIILCVN